MSTKTMSTIETTVMTTEAAEAVTTEIRDAGKSLIANRSKFAGAVKRAKDGQAHVGMGFKSWTEYVATVFADMPGLGKADAEYLTAFMAGEGMSSRAVARILGVSQSTAARMIRQAEAEGKVDPERKVDSKDGKSRKASGKGGRKAGSAGRKTPKTPEAPKTPKTPEDKTPEAPKTPEVKTPEVKTVTRPDAVKGSKTDDLLKTALAILAELSDRWAEGDEAAEMAMLELAEAALIA